MPPYQPYVEGFTLGTSPEVLNPYWQQFTADGFPAGINNCGVLSDLAVIMPLTSAQLLALQTTAVQLVAPPPLTSGSPSYLIPPSGFVYIPTYMTMQYKFGGTAYTIGNADNKFQIEYTGQSTLLLSLNATGLVDQGVGKVASNNVAATGPVLTVSTAANLGLELKLTGTTPALTLGNGTCFLTLLYNAYILF